MKSVYTHRFLLRVGQAVRAGWACLMVAGLLLYAKAVADITAVPVLAPVLAILLAGPSLGTVLYNSVGILTVVVPALASTIAVLQILSPPISKITSVVCIAISSYVISYFSGTHLMGRKVALAQTSIVYVLAHYNKDLNISTYPPRLIFPAIIGIVFAIVATLFPFPRLAAREVRVSSKFVVRGASELFKTLVKTISICNLDLFGSLLLHSSVLSKATSDSLAEFKSKQVHVSWELGMCGARHASEEFTKGLQNCTLHLKGMELALQSGYVLTSTILLRCGLKSSLEKVVESCKSLLTASADDLLLLRGASRENHSTMQRLIEDAKDALHILDLNYLSAREKAYYSPSSVHPDFSSDTDTDEDERRENAFLPLRTNRDFRSRTSMIFFIFNLRLYCLEVINLGCKGHCCTVSKMGKFGPKASASEASGSTRMYGPQVGGGTPAEKNAPDVDPIFVELAKPPFQSSEAKQIGSMDSNHFSAHDSSSRRFDSGARKLGGLDSGRFSTHGFSSRRLGFQGSVSHGEIQPETRKIHPSVDSEDDDNERHVEEMKTSSISISNAEANSDPNLKVNSSIPRSSSSLRSRPSLPSGLCTHVTGAAMDQIIDDGKGYSGTGGQIWKRIRKLGFKLSKTQSKRSFKAALSMASAAVVGILVLNKQQAYWAPVTVGFLIGNYQGGSWRISYLRLLGTVLGAIYGFLALSASHHYRVAILGLLIPWVTLSSFVRASPIYGYAGVVSAFTAAILMLGGYHNEARQYAFDRITLTFLGILCFVFVETVLLPERAANLVRKEFVSSLADLKECVKIIIKVYTEHGLCLECRSKAVKALKVLVQRLRASFAHQTALREEAALEPELWFVPFPAEVYSNLIAIQGRMLDLLFFMECSLHATTEDCRTTTDQMEVLLRPLTASLMAIQGEVLGTIDTLRETLDMKKFNSWEWDVLHGLKRLVWRCASTMRGTVERGREGRRDVENPTTGQVDANHPLLMLGHRHRSADGIPLTLKSAIDSFENSFQKVLDDVITTTMAQEEMQLIRNDVILSIGSLTFSLHAILRQTVHLENAVHELLQAENLWNVLDFWENINYVDEAIHSAERQ